jgi:hypothetical protein
LNEIKIKEAKERTSQEAELLGVEMTHESIKHYITEVLADISNEPQSDRSSQKLSSTSDQQESSMSSGKSIAMENHQKCFVLKSTLSCLSAPHGPKIQQVNRKSICDICSLGIECFNNSESHRNSDSMKEYREQCDMQKKNASPVQNRWHYGFSW